MVIFLSLSKQFFLPCKFCSTRQNVYKKQKQRNVGVTTCKGDFAACGQSRYCRSLSIVQQQLADISNLGHKLKFLVAHTACHKFLFPLNVILRRICGRTPLKWASGLLVNTSTKRPCRQQLLEFPWIRQCVCVAPARGSRRAQAAQFDLKLAVRCGSTFLTRLRMNALHVIGHRAIAMGLARPHISARTLNQNVAEARLSCFKSGKKKTLVSNHANSFSSRCKIIKSFRL